MNTDKIIAESIAKDYPILDRFHYPRNEQHYVMMFYLNGITAIITEWIKEGCNRGIADISTIIHYCIFGREQ